MAKGSALRKPSNDAASAEFAALLEESLGGSASFEGTVVKGRVIRIANDFVVVDVGLKSEGRVALREFSNGGTTAPEAGLNYLRLGETLGIDPRYTGSLNMGGGTAGSLLHQAALAVNAGMANYVACVFGDAAATGGLCEALTSHMLIRVTCPSALCR